jgi:hypothetical protein
MRFGLLALALGLTAHLALGAADPKPAVAAKPATTGAPAAKPAPVKAITGKVTAPDGKPVGASAIAIWPAVSRGPGRADLPKSVVANTDESGSFRLDGVGRPFALRVARQGSPAAACAGRGPQPALETESPWWGACLATKPVANAAVTARARRRALREAAHTAPAGKTDVLLADCARRRR